ncbi:MAG TPA: hypothetical protein GX506_03830 [Firmicutes bacterium]|nr:hypothetical protein [Bacillota bacterium]
MERYPVLRIVVGLSNVIAYGLAALLVVVGGILGAIQESILTLIGSVILAFLVWLGMKAYSEVIQVFVNIEKNTRLYQDILPLARGQDEIKGGVKTPQA